MFSAALIEPHPLLRLGLLRVLRGMEDISESSSFAPHELLAAESSPVNLPARADILLFGLSDDPAADYSLLDRALTRIPCKHVLLLHGGGPLPPWRHQAVGGCVAKDASAEQVSAAIRLVLAGGKCFPAAWSTEPGPHHLAVPPPLAANGAPAPGAPGMERPHAAVLAAGSQLLGITPRQFEVLLLLARGLSLKKVGRMLNISVATVKSHASAMYRRLNAKNKQQAIHEALVRGADLRDSGAPYPGENGWRPPPS